MTALLLRIISFVALAFIFGLVFRAARRAFRLGAGVGNAGGAGAPGSRQSSSDPYSILGISPGASQEEIRSAYKKVISEYHPDRVATLGDDFKKLAQVKTREIIEAYEALSK